MHDGSRPARGPAAPCGACWGADTAVTCMPQRRSALGRLVMTRLRQGRLPLPRKGWAAHRNRTDSVTHSGDDEGNTPRTRSPERPIARRDTSLATAGSPGGSAETADGGPRPAHLGGCSLPGPLRPRGEGATRPPSRYQDHHRILRDHFSQDVTFCTSLEEFGSGYHSKNSGGASEAELERRIQRSSEYFLEEFAVFCCRKDSGLPVMLYPGSFGTLSEIAAGDHEGALKQLRDLIVVSLRLRGRAPCPRHTPVPRS